MWPQDPPPLQVLLPFSHAQSIVLHLGNAAAWRGTKESPPYPLKEASSPSSMMMEKSCAVWDLRVAKH